MFARPRLLPLADHAWTVEFADAIEPAALDRVAAFAAAVERARRDDPAFAAVVDVVPTFRSLTVHLDPPGAGGDALSARFLALADGLDATPRRGRLWHLPASFADAFAPDLGALAAAAGLDPAAAVALLVAARFRVAMIGFMPGFPYMTGLPEPLRRARRATPRTAVPARSLAVAEEMCAVYPWPSPGGWHLVGSTPLDLFDPADPDPALLAAGDTVVWRPVDAAEYADLRADLLAGRRDRRDFLAAEDAP